MPAQAEYHTQAQATYNYFGHHCRIQQESHEEALQVVRDYHHQALATAAVLEGHIEWLSHSHLSGAVWQPEQEAIGQPLVVRKQEAFQEP